MTILLSKSKVKYKKLSKQKMAKTSGFSHFSNEHRLINDKEPLWPFAHQH